MREAIAAGLENAPIGVVTTPELRTLDTSQQSPCRCHLRSAQWSTFKGFCLRQAMANRLTYQDRLELLISAVSGAALGIAAAYLD
jgi:hypothetical protein